MTTKLTYSFLFAAICPTGQAKLFAQNIDDAITQGNKTGAEFNVIQVDVPNSVFNKLQKHDLDAQVMKDLSIGIEIDQFEMFNNSVRGATVIR